MTKAVLSLGSNLGDLDGNLDRAIELISARIGPIQAASSRRSTEPVLHPDTPTAGQGKYRNMALVVETSLDALQLLDACQQVEKDVGRLREREKVRWEPRILDVDIIAFDDVVMTSPRLQIPHPEMHHRRFVLEPLAEIWPGWCHPILGRTAIQLLHGLTVGSTDSTLVSSHAEFMRRAVALASDDIDSPNGRPLGAVVVRNGSVIGEGRNLVNVLCDPTAHAEVTAIRDACRNLGQPHINGSILYCTAEPCPLCLAACYWAGITEVYYGLSSRQAEPFGFADSELYTEFALPAHCRRIALVQIADDALISLFEAFARSHPDYKTSLLRHPTYRFGTDSPDRSAAKRDVVK
ncbi:MAG: 2-amino-4-hydroxy-6-hydroxymethyldihydropteridine diphosphokinase [Phycisphaerales bacterium]